MNPRRYRPTKIATKIAHLKIDACLVLSFIAVNHFNDFLIAPNMV
jgi:hypothetical protein